MSRSCFRILSKPPGPESPSRRATVSMARQRSAQKRGCRYVALLAMAPVACACGGSRSALGVEPADASPLESTLEPAPRDAAPPCVAPDSLPDLCSSGPIGAVVSTSGPGDCFATPTTGSIWQTTTREGRGWATYICGDVAVV